jgi:hypothetical protein
MKIKLNSWLGDGYEGWFDREFVFEFDKWEISLDKPYRYGRRILAHVIGAYATVEMTRRDMGTLFLLLSETKDKGEHNEGKAK